VSDALLVPYCGVRYHLKEWRQANLRYAFVSVQQIIGNLITNHVSPQDKKELFNLCHTVLQNIVEHIFGVMKWKWRILQLPPEYKMEVQACIPAALCAIHNFIQNLHPETFFEPEFEMLYLAQTAKEDNVELFGELREGPADGTEW